MRGRQRNNLVQGAEHAYSERHPAASLASSDSFTKGGDANGKANQLALTDTQGQERAGVRGDAPPRRGSTHEDFPIGPVYQPVPPWQPIASLLGIIALGIWMLWVTVGCSGSSPTEAGITEIATAYGMVTVVGTMDTDAVRRGIEDGYELVNAQGPWALDAAGLTVMQGDGVRWHGRYYRDRDLVEVARPSDLVHEVHHRAAWQLGRHAECRELQGHEDGYDLHCDRRDT